MAIYVFRPTLPEGQPPDYPAETLAYAEIEVAKFEVEGNAVSVDCIPTFSTAYNFYKELDKHRDPERYARLIATPTKDQLGTLTRGLIAKLKTIPQPFTSPAYYFTDYPEGNIGAIDLLEDDPWAEKFPAATREKFKRRRFPFTDQRKIWGEQMSPDGIVRDPLGQKLWVLVIGCELALELTGNPYRDLRRKDVKRLSREESRKIAKAASKTHLGKLMLLSRDYRGAPKTEPEGRIWKKALALEASVHEKARQKAAENGGAVVIDPGEVCAAYMELGYYAIDVMENEVFNYPAKPLTSSVWDGGTWSKAYGNGEYIATENYWKNFQTAFCGTPDIVDRIIHNFADMERYHRRKRQHGIHPRTALSVWEKEGFTCNYDYREGLFDNATYNDKPDDIFFQD